MWAACELSLVPSSLLAPSSRSIVTWRELFCARSVSTAAHADMVSNALTDQLAPYA